MYILVKFTALGWNVGCHYGASMKGITEITIPIAKFSSFIKQCDLNERQRRCTYGFIASLIGYGGVAAVVRELNTSLDTVNRGLMEFSAMNKESTPATTTEETAEKLETAGDVTEPPVEKGRIRKRGGGRKSIVYKWPEIINAIEAHLEDHTYGDPMRLLRWTTLSLRKLKALLKKQGFDVSHTVVGAILDSLGYSKQANQKMIQVSKPHPNRDQQFCYINDKAAQFLRAGSPVISIDCKKKENVGNYKNPGQEYRPKGDPRQVPDHDFAGKLGKVAPYGIY